MQQEELHVSIVRCFPASLRVSEPETQNCGLFLALLLRPSVKTSSHLANQGAADLSRAVTGCEGKSSCLDMCSRFDYLVSEADADMPEQGKNVGFFPLYTLRTESLNAWLSSFLFLPFQFFLRCWFRGTASTTPSTASWRSSATWGKTSPTCRTTRPSRTLSSRPTVTPSPTRPAAATQTRLGAAVAPTRILRPAQTREALSRCQVQSASLEKGEGGWTSLLSWIFCSITPNDHQHLCSIAS